VKLPSVNEQRLVMPFALRSCGAPVGFKCLADGEPSRPVHGSPTDTTWPAEQASENRPAGDPRQAPRVPASGGAPLPPIDVPDSPPRSVTISEVARRARPAACADTAAHAPETPGSPPLSVDGDRVTPWRCARVG
jgi:hypothetical protein